MNVNSKVSAFPFIGGAFSRYFLWLFLPEFSPSTEINVKRKELSLREGENSLIVPCHRIGLQFHMRV
jgi:hypothetical protein